MLTVGTDAYITVSEADEIINSKAVEFLNDGWKNLMYLTVEHLGSLQLLLYSLFPVQSRNKWPGHRVALEKTFKTAV